MRISVNKNDPGHADYARLLRQKKTITVTLNDEVVADVVTADEEQGFIVTYVRDAEGQPVRIGDVLETISRGGAVVIKAARNPAEGGGA